MTAMTGAYIDPIAHMRWLAELQTLTSTYAIEGKPVIMATHTHDPKDDEAIAQKHLDEQAALHRHQRRQDANLDVSLVGLNPLLANVAALLEVGIPVDDLTDHVADQLQFANPDAVDALAKVLTAAHKHVRKAHDDRVKAEDARVKAEDKQQQ